MVSMEEPRRSGQSGMLEMEVKAKMERSVKARWSGEPGLRRAGPAWRAEHWIGARSRTPPCGGDPPHCELALPSLASSVSLPQNESRGWEGEGAGEPSRGVANSQPLLGLPGF